MAGVRLHHPSFTSCTLVVELELPYPGGAYACPSCDKEHQRKAIHLRLDADGDVIVSREVYAQLRTVFLAGMEVANEVKNPPPLLLGAVAQPGYRTVTAPLNAQNAEGFYRPGRTKYESRDLMVAPFQPLIDAALDKQDRIDTAKKKEKRTLFLLGRRK